MNQGFALQMRRKPVASFSPPPPPYQEHQQERQPTLDWTSGPPYQQHQLHQQEREPTLDRTSGPPYQQHQQHRQPPLDWTSGPPSFEHRALSSRSNAPWTDERARPVSRSATDDKSRLRPPDRLRLKTSLPELSRFAQSSPSSPFNTTPNTPISAPGPPGLEPNFPPSSAAGEKSGFWQSAISETRHFAEGLMPHPAESTKHYTILRHSPPLIFYRGPTTSVAITVFSASHHPLPANRTLWLQQRGFSGDSGMKIKALVGATSNWLDVTPSELVQARELSPDSERSWQRDIAKVAKKSLKDKGHKKAHVARETHVVRIPAACNDGYFRLVLCSGGSSSGNDDGKSSRRKDLCHSPVFRVASTSSDSSMFRGASLSTMPLEIGVKVASVATQVAITRYTGPVAGVVQGRLAKSKTGVVALKAGKVAYGALSPAAGGPRDDEPSYFPTPLPGAAAGPAGYDCSIFETGGVIGPDEGPQQPFPLKFQSRITAGTGRSMAELGIPTANLAGAPDEVLNKLRGVYFCWACIMPERGFEGISDEWHEAVLAAGPSPYGRPSVVSTTTAVTVHLVHDFGRATTFFGARMKVVVMGFLRPALPRSAPLEQRLEAVSLDVCAAMASLGRDNWAPDAAVHQLQTAKSARSLSDKFSAVRDNVQNRVASLPVHRMGIRTADAEQRDLIHGTGGYWVAR
ncbi:hypothetical protein B0T26DRAFT_713327 [Lasiosphaeria miniovina]|uniref:Riboflavin kinase n=1 Tax=Lasiosphaeria miniovina TaxID=1954250 RepID=A0AA40AM77_9PEZI|nr:uncharacterized protein B0T26DRAFT_713327 [Lasiosphaeria miniovina]KAK0718436.1 hypothetical protein B0T26DRAFT_713327 [Lasiosphaeria miniovina]